MARKVCSASSISCLLLIDSGDSLFIGTSFTRLPSVDFILPLPADGFVNRPRPVPCREDRPRSCEAVAVASAPTWGWPGSDLPPPTGGVSPGQRLRYCTALLSDPR